jgi:alcohol dehydrogenase class IV
MRLNHFQPTELIFGRGRLGELGSLVRRFGTRTLLVTGKDRPAVTSLVARARQSLAAADVEVCHFDGVVPNPTVDSISAGAARARQFGAQSVIGLGGGSAMDSAKAIAVEAVHEGTSWDYLFYKKAPTDATLPVVAVSTTSGTGSQVTQVAVITNTEARDKSAIYHANVFPKVAIVDPELMLSVPRDVTACTGFDVFCHAFESTLHPNCHPLVESWAWDAIGRVVGDLPRVLADGGDIDARESMAWADTLAGYSIAAAGVTLPHGMGMAIGGMYPHVAHGVSLAIVYPAFARFTWNHAIPQFSRVARLFEPGLAGAADQAAAHRAPALIEEFLTSIGLRVGLADVQVPEAELPALTRQCMVLPDYQGNPRVATPEEMAALLAESFTVAGHHEVTA